LAITAQLLILSLVSSMMKGKESIYTLLKIKITDN